MISSVCYWASRGLWEGDMSALERGIGRLCICRVDIEIVWQWCCALRTLLLRFSGHSKLWVVMPMNCVAGVLPTYPCPSGSITPVTAVRSANEYLLGAVKRGLFCCRGTTHSIIGHRYIFALTLFVNANMSSDKHVVVVCYVLKCSKSRQRGNMQAVHVITSRPVSIGYRGRAGKARILLGQSGWKHL